MGTYDGEIGRACSTFGSECAAILGGYCAGVGVCTTYCLAHDDCGCPPGTTNDDIAAGACSAACVDTSGLGDTVCLRVCGALGLACEGVTQTCTQLSGYAVCY